MKLEILTLFPGIFDSFLKASLIEKAIQSGKLEVTITNIRDFAHPPHFKVDDTPYGGGPGMVLKPEPLALAIEQAKQRLPRSRTILFTPAGKHFSQREAQRLQSEDELIFICGRYEGIDERINTLYVDEELSLGDFVLMGGEVPAMAVMEAIVRLQPEVLGNSASIEEESFSVPGKLEAPHYTRPPSFKGLSVPDELLSGNHERIRIWKEKASKERTERNRPELISANIASSERKSP